MNYNISDDLITIRKILNISQNDLAKELGISKMTIIRIENNVNYPSKTILAKIYDFAYNKNIKLNHLKELFYKEELLENDVLLFHGTKTDIIGNISPFVGRERLDFGKGFYCGESSYQTISFISKYEGSSIYILKASLNDLTFAKFNVDTEWMLAIAYYRQMLNDKENHPLIDKIKKKVSMSDYIIAPIADNRMFKIIDRFIEGEITDEQCKHCLAATDLGYQYVFLTEKAASKIKILERCYISKLERDTFEAKRETDMYDSNMKVKMAMIKYKTKGKYIEEILK